MANQVPSGQSSNVPPVQSSLPSGAVSSLATSVGAISTVANTIGQVSGEVGLAAQSLGISSNNVNTAVQIAKTAATAISAVGAVTQGLMSNDPIAAFRSINLPTNIPGLSGIADIVRIFPATTGDWRVTIDAPISFGRVVFPVLPTMTLGFKATYIQPSIVHTNYLFNAFKNSSPDDIQISCEWPVETVQDGLDYLDMVLFGRTVTKMFYGSGPNVGQPPLICTLKGYGASGTGSKILPDMPIIVKQFTTDLKPDVNYLKCGNDYVPRLSTVTFLVSPIYSRAAQRSFNLYDYRVGAANIKY